MFIAASLADIEAADAVKLAGIIPTIENSIRTVMNELIILFIIKSLPFTNNI